MSDLKYYCPQCGYEAGQFNRAGLSIHLKRVHRSKDLLLPFRDYFLNPSLYDPNHMSHSTRYTGATPRTAANQQVEMPQTPNSSDHPFNVNIQRRIDTAIDAAMSTAVIALENRITGTIANSLKTFFDDWLTNHSNTQTNTSGSLNTPSTSRSEAQNATPIHQPTIDRMFKRCGTNVFVRVTNTEPAVITEIEDEDSTPSVAVDNTNVPSLNINNDGINVTSGLVNEAPPVYVVDTTVIPPDVTACPTIDASAEAQSVSVEQEAASTTISQVGNISASDAEMSKDTMQILKELAEVSDEVHLGSDELQLDSSIVNNGGTPATVVSTNAEPTLIVSESAEPTPIASESVEKPDEICLNDDENNGEIPSPVIDSPLKTKADLVNDGVLVTSTPRVVVVQTYRGGQMELNKVVVDEPSDTSDQAVIIELSDDSLTPQKRSAEDESPIISKRSKPGKSSNESNSQSE